jgi:hypothetical protein
MQFLLITRFLKIGPLWMRLSGPKIKKSDIHTTGVKVAPVGIIEVSQINPVCLTARGAL